MEIPDTYELISLVSARTWSTVWKARDRRLDRLVAIKALEASDPVLLERWRTESRVLAQLEHPNLVEVYAYTETDGGAYIVEEWLEAATVSEILASRGAMSPAQALGIMRGALLGLSFAHENGLVHGDVSPSNILVGADAVSRLIDFGSAAPSGSVARPGTSAYQAPEVGRGGPTSPRADVFAAAAVIATLLRDEPTPTPTADGVGRLLRPVLRTA